MRTDPNDYQCVKYSKGNVRVIFYFQQTVGLDSVKRNILKRYSDLDYDSFVGLMGRRNASEISFLMALSSLFIT